MVVRTPVGKSAMLSSYKMFTGRSSVA